MVVASEVSRSVNTSLALMLLGSVAWVMSLFYFVNSADSDIRQATWETLNSMLSIFCAVLLFAATKDVSVDFFGEAEGDHHSPPDARKFGISLLRVTVFFFVVQALLFYYR